MSAGRKPLAAPVEDGQAPVVLEGELAQAMSAMHEMGVAEQAVMKYEGALRQLGQIEGLSFIRNVGDVAIAQVFENLRISGGYKGLPYRDAGGNLRHVGDIKELCEVKLGKSYSRCMDLSANLRVLGEELYERSERLGLRAVDYKALRALPEDDQVLVKKAVEETSSRDEVLEVLQQLAVKAAAKKQESKKRIADLEADIVAKDERIAIKSEQLDAAEVKVRGFAKLPPDEKVDVLMAEATKQMNAALAAINGQFRQALLALEALDQGEAGIKDYRPLAAGLVGQLQQSIATIRDEFLLTDIIGDGTPEWVRATAGMGDEA